MELEKLDKFILLLTGFSVLVDMVNGFFMREFVPMPISQGYKLILIFLILLRLAPTKDFLPVLVVLFGFQIAPFVGLIKTGELATFFNDVVVASKWIMVPLSFFFFKNLFRGKRIFKKKSWLVKMIGLSLLFLSLNMLLGAMGYGSAFYYDGFSNAAGTKGYIYAGNELTILVLTLAFLISAYLWNNNRHITNGLFFMLFLVFAFLITSKTVIGGVVIVFLIPYLGPFPAKFKRKWIDRIIGIALLGVPLLVAGFYYGLTRSGFLRNLQYNKQVNEDLVTILLSNRNNFVLDGWKVFVQEYNWIEKIIGLGESFHLKLSGNLAEIDFITLLFSNGIFGLILLLVLLLYYFLNSRLLMPMKKYPYARSVFLFLVFLCLAANSAGHVFNSGIAGLFIGVAIALMFYPREVEEAVYNRPKASDNP